MARPRTDASPPRSVPSHAPRRAATADLCGPDHAPGAGPATTVEIGLTAAILSVIDNEPIVLVVADGTGETASEGLPSGPFSPLEHRTLEIGLRSYVQRQTGLELGYVEQLYTFADRGRHLTRADAGAHVVSIGYLALTTSVDTPSPSIRWRSWYHYFPWEDRRRETIRRAAVGERGNDDALASLLPPLTAWAATPPAPGAPARPIARADRVRMCFATEGAAWDEEKVLERYELLYEAGLVAEARRDGRPVDDPAWPALGPAMRFDHRRILATAIGRMRGKIKYRPVIFELLPEVFTLYDLQRTVEAILGPHLHKQNFRRLVESGGLVEPTADMRTGTGGRPARLYRFRREVMLERPAPGVRVNPRV